MGQPMDYREELPEGCPPNEADEIHSPRDVFRAVRQSPPDLRDFRSQRAERPTQDFSGVTECQARGVSVFARRQDCENLLRLPRMKNRLIARVRLEDGAGRIQQTFRESHHTWWPTADFDILGHTSIEAT